jgi:hypothetical protein
VGVLFLVSLVFLSFLFLRPFVCSGVPTSFIKFLYLLIKKKKKIHNKGLIFLISTYSNRSIHSSVSL